MADDRRVTPLFDGKRPDYTHRPRGAYAWLAILLPVLAYELWGVARDVEHTLSRTVWWLLGPAYEPRWWLAGLPLAALLAWTGPHFLWPGTFGGRELLVILAVALVSALVGVALTR